jgi:hypothetical protein
MKTNPTEAKKHTVMNEEGLVTLNKNAKFLKKTEKGIINHLV